MKAEMMGRTLGYILIGGGVLAALIIAGVMFAPMLEGTRSAGAAFLGFALFSIVWLIPLGAGIFMLWKGAQEAEVAGRATLQRKLLNIIKTQGQVPVSDLAIEMNSTREEVQNLLYDLVGRGLFSGYVNWDEGMLYSEQASHLRERSTCAVCGGQLELAGQGVIRCPYCGTEYFLD
jgi:hypothetical protein